MRPPCLIQHKNTITLKVMREDTNYTKIYQTPSLILCMHQFAWCNGTEIMNLQALSQPRQWLGHVAGEPKVARAIHIRKENVGSTRHFTISFGDPLDSLDSFRLLTAAGFFRDTSEKLADCDVDVPSLEHVIGQWPTRFESWLPQGTGSDDPVGMGQNHGTPVVQSQKCCQNGRRWGWIWCICKCEIVWDWPVPHPFIE